MTWTSICVVRTCYTASLVHFCRDMINPCLLTLSSPTLVPAKRDFTLSAYLFLPSGSKRLAPYKWNSSHYMVLIFRLLGRDEGFLVPFGFGERLTMLLVQ